MKDCIVYQAWNSECDWHIKLNCHSQQQQALKILAVDQARDWWLCGSKRRHGILDGFLWMWGVWAQLSEGSF